MARRAHRAARWMVGALTVAALAISGLAYVVSTGVAPAFAASSVGGQITSSEVIARAYDWFDRAPAYSPTTYIWDVGQTREYRTDCSGFIDMALHLDVDDNTAAIAQDSARFTLISAPGGDKSNLQPGDVLDDVIDGHAFLFEAWEADHVHFSYFNFGGGSDGHQPPEHHIHETFSQPEVGYEPTSNYAVYRYKNISNVADPDPAQYVFYRGGNGRIYEAYYHVGDGWHGGLDMCGTYGWGCTPSTGPGAAVNPATNAQYVFYRGSDANIYEAYYQAGTWNLQNMCTSHNWGCGVADEAPDVGASS
jgi:hypothetical protein